jgi:hypothetical protein
LLHRENVELALTVQSTRRKGFFHLQALFSALGIANPFFIHFFVLGAGCLAMGNGWVGGGKHLVIKSTIDIVGFGILWVANLFKLTTLVLILVFIRNLVTIAYSAAVGGHSKELLQDMVWQLQCHFGAGAVAGACLAWTILGTIMDIMVPLILCSLAIMVVVLCWYKMTMAHATGASTGDSQGCVRE